MQTRRQGPRRRGLVLGVAVALLAVLVPAQAATAAPGCEVSGSRLIIRTDAGGFINFARSSVSGRFTDADRTSISCSYPAGSIALVDVRGTDVQGELSFGFLQGFAGARSRPDGTSGVDVELSDVDRPSIAIFNGFDPDAPVTVRGHQDGSDVVLSLAASGATARVDLGGLVEFGIEAYAGPLDLDLSGGSAGPPVEERVTVDGTFHADRMVAGVGEATFDAGSGDDVLVGGPSEDFLYGDNGNDTITSREPGARRRDVVDCGAGQDTGTADRLDRLTACEFGPITAALTDVVADEGDSGETTAALRLAVANADKPVQYVVRSVAAPGDTATAGEDVRPVVVSGTTTTSLDIPVTVLGDALDEPDEVASYVLEVTDDPDTVNADGAARLTVRDDDATPVATAASATATEGQGTDVTIALAGASGSEQAVTVGAEGVTPVRATFPPRATSATVTLTPQDDDVSQPGGDRVRVITLTDPTAGLVPAEAQGTLTVRDDDPLPRAAVASVRATEGGTSEARLTLDRASSQPQSADLLLDGRPAGAFTVPAGAVTATTTLRAPDDDVFQGDRELPLALTGRSDGLAGDGGTATLTLVDDEPAPTITASSARVREGGTAEVVLRLSGPAAVPVERTVTVRPGTASVADLAVPPAPAIAFAAGERQRTVAVATAQDGLAEPEEQLAIVPSGAGDTPGTVTIEDDDTAVPPACAGLELALLDARPRAGRIAVTGFALPRYAGRTVSISGDGRRLGTAVVGRDGVFRASVRRARRYGARLGGAVSRSFRLERRLVVTRVTTRGRTARITGRLTTPRRQRPATLRLTRRTPCGPEQAAGRVRLGRDGRFTASVARPTAAEGLVVHRLIAERRGTRSFSVPVAVR